MGSIIEQSTIGIRSFIDSGTLVQRSVIMGNNRYETIEDRISNQERGIPNLGIGANCVIKNAIIDMDVRIGNNVQLINKEGVSETIQDNYAIREGIIILPKGVTLGHNTVI